MKCPRCEKESQTDALRCWFCGYTLIESQTSSGPTTLTLNHVNETPGIGTLFSDRFRILEELGVGSMGRVFRAFDTKINEVVALKFLKAELSTDRKFIDRFSNEVRLARKITHKNVCRIYELMESKGTYFITMEYVAGENLRQLINRQGRPSLAQAYSIGIQIAEGLAEAYQLGIIHRDLKLSNIMIDGSERIRIMDFGLSHSIMENRVTSYGNIVGTPSYMSPEQATGDKLDQRSDIYSFGIILYELLTGKLPFEADSPAGIIFKHINERPPEPRKFDPNLSPKASIAVLKCIEKEKDRRYQNIDEVLRVLSELKRDSSPPDKVNRLGQQVDVTLRKVRWVRSILIGTAISAAILVVVQFSVDPSLRYPKMVLSRFSVELRRTSILRSLAKYERDVGSIAVLPISNMTNNLELSVSSARISEELTNELTRSGYLPRVVPQASMRQYQARLLSIPKIAEEVGADIIVEGSLISSEKDTLSIKLKIFHGLTEKIIAECGYDLDSGNSVDLNVGARYLSNSILVKLAAFELDEVIRKSSIIPNDKIPEFCRKGQKLLYMGHEAEFLANTFFNASLRANPKAYQASIGKYLLKCKWFEESRNFPVAEYSQLRKFLEEIQELDWLTRIQIAFKLRFFSEGVEKAPMNRLKLFPEGVGTGGWGQLPSGYTFPFRPVWASTRLCCLNRLDDAEKIMMEALETDRYSPIYNFEMGRIKYYKRENDDALKYLSLANKISPDFRYIHRYLGMVYLQKKEYKAALAEFKGGDILTWPFISDSAPYNITPFHPMNLPDDLVILAQLKLGDKADAEKHLLERVDLFDKWGAVDAYSLALIYSAKGSIDQVFSWLDKAQSKRNCRLAFIQVEPLLDPIRHDDRYGPFIRSLGMN